MGFGNLFKRLRMLNDYEANIRRLEDEYECLTKRNEQAKQDVAISVQKCEKEIADSAQRIEIIKERTERQRAECAQKLQQALAEYEDKEETAKKRAEREEAKLLSLKKKSDVAKENYQRMLYALEQFQPDSTLQGTDGIEPEVHLKLYSEDLADLRKMMRDNNKRIETVLKAYEGRYTTKAIMAIYQLMTIALRAELQNVLYSLRYEKLNDAITHIKNITAKYLAIAESGNQVIAGTLHNFIGEIEYLFIQSVEIEYEYYVRKQRIKEEQQALREQMRIEREEQKALELERKKLEAEENKYNIEIQNLTEKLENVSAEERETIKERIVQLQDGANALKEKKAEIIQLQNGKAGNVYIISNLGAFGDHMFKIGMTRRSNPQDRVDELGDASVPFRFDVHSFIFSEDAVSLENQLHTIFNDRRVNKVNMRKEFFDISIDELADTVEKLQPTAEFNKTMLAEEYRQSLSIDGALPLMLNEDDGEEDIMEA